MLHLSIRQEDVSSGYGIVDEMTSIAVWNCADPQMICASGEVESLENYRSDEVDVVVAGHALEWDGLGGFIQAVKPSIFHFIGHGTSHGELIVNEGGNKVARSIASVLAVVRAANPGLEGVYLSGCHTSATGPEPLDLLAPSGGWVVGTSGTVDDDVAMIFTQKFYEHLFNHNGDVSSAFRVAKAYVEADLGEDAPYSMWMSASSMPPVDQMAQTVFTALRGVFSRSAMQMPMALEVSVAELDCAMQDISHALGTGEVRSRRTGVPIDAASFPAEWLYDPLIADFVDEARRGISSVRRDIDKLRQGAGSEDRVIGNVLNFDQTVSQAEWMRRVNKVDRGRNRVIKALNKLLNISQVPPLKAIHLSFSAEAIARVEQHKG